MLPREISVEHWPERTTFTLPARPLGRWRWLGLAPMAFSLVFAGAPMGILGPSLRQFAQGGNGPGRWVFILIIALFMCFALMPFGIGLFLLAGHCRLVVSRDRITATEIAGPIFWRRKARVKDIERLEIGAAGQVGDRVPSRVPFAFGALTAVLKNGRRTIVAVGYPSEWMAAIAAEIGGLLKLQGASVAVREVGLEQPDATPATKEVACQPPNSRVTVGEAGGGVQLSVPSRGFWKESYGLVLFGGFWCAMTGAITTAICVSPQGRHRGDLGLPGMTALLALFWAVGIVMTLLGIHFGTRRWSIQAGREGLSVKVESALRSRNFQWQRAELLSVRVGDSSVEVNHRRLREIQIQPLTGKHKGLLAGRDEQELAWVASLLRRGLGMK